MKKKLWYAVLILIVFLGLAQFIPVKYPEITPVNPTEDFLIVNSASAQISTIIKASCYDCHSSETKYNWYNKIAPASWLVANHVREGREKINFSGWTRITKKKSSEIISECAEEVEEGGMPLKGYSLIHKDARLSAEQKKILVNWFKKLASENDETKQE